MGESFDMTTIEGCIGWGLCLDPPERGRLEAELARLRAIEAAERERLIAVVDVLRDAANMGMRLVDPEPTPEELRRAEALARRLGR